MLLGVPFGVNGFTVGQMKELVLGIAAQAQRLNLNVISDGKIHFMILRYCLLTSLIDWLRCLPPALWWEAARIVDNSVIAAAAAY